ncbi:MAG: sle [Microbacteriaceae bacterium]|jgi:4-hydroxyphenylpyruvate dioxygenase|nr:sle [Microbacteriaceae bacterium]
MKTAIATVSLSGSLDEKLDAIASAGFSGVELFDGDLVASFHRPETVATMIQQRGLQLYLYQPLRDIEGWDADEFRRAHDRAQRKLEIAARLGAPTVLVCSNAAPHAIADDSRSASQLAKLGDTAAQFDIRIAYEALAWGSHVNTWEHAWSLVQQSGHPNVGLCVDSFHLFARSPLVPDLSHVPGDRIFYYQIADAYWRNRDYLSWSRHERLFPGQGQFPIAELTSEVLNAGYTGPLSIEVFNDLFRETDPGRTSRDALRGLRYLEGQLLASQSLPNAESLSRDGDSIALAHAHPAEEWDFVEIATNQPDEINRTLRQLGFTHCGKHRHKTAELWTQQDVRIVIVEGSATAEVTGFGVKVLDLDRLEQRLDLMLAPNLHRITPPGDEPLIGVKSPSGIGLYFSKMSDTRSPAWVEEFSSPHGYIPSDIGIIAIDHLSINEPPETFHEAILFFRATAALEPESEVEIPSESGIVRSVALHSRLGDTRLVLNVAPASHAESIPQPEPNHVAFHVRDIVSTVSQYCRNGGKLVPLPPNYYDDLEARMPELAAERDTLEQLSIMCAAESGGLVLHAYTEAVGGVFFELIERRGTLTGYGASDSSVRRAAQRVNRAQI